MLPNSLPFGHNWYTIITRKQGRETNARRSRGINFPVIYFNNSIPIQYEEVGTQAD
jgi:hypothetical protein